MPVPARAEACDSHRDTRTRHQQKDAEEMVQLPVLAGWRAEHQREDGGIQADERGAPRGGEGGGNERPDRQETDQPECPPVHLVDDGHSRHPDQGHPGDHRLHAVRGRMGLVTWCGFAVWFGHVVLPLTQWSWVSSSPTRYCVGAVVPNATCSRPTVAPVGGWCSVRSGFRLTS